MNHTYTYTITNNNPQNFKLTYMIDGKPQKAQLSTVNDTCIAIAPRVKVQVNPYGTIYGDGHEITQHTMTEEELFQDMLVDPLSVQKKLAAELLRAFYVNECTMTEELVEMIFQPTRSLDLVATKSQPKSVQSRKKQTKENDQ